MSDLNDPIVSDEAVGTGETAPIAAAAVDPAAVAETLKHPWMQQAPNDLKKNEILGEFDGVGPLCKAHVELHAELAELKKSMEVPGGVDGYNLGDPQLPEGLAKDADMELKFKQFCIDNKIGLGQAKALFGFYNSSLATRYNTVMQNRSNAEAETDKLLKGEWGDEGYTTKTAQIGTLIDEKAGKDAARVKEVFDKAAVYGDPATLRFFAAVAADYGQHRLVEGETVGITGTEPARPKAQPGEPPKTVDYGPEFREFAAKD